MAGVGKTEGPSPLQTNGASPGRAVTLRGGAPRLSIPVDIASAMYVAQLHRRGAGEQAAKSASAIATSKRNDQLTLEREAMAAAQRAAEEAAESSKSSSFWGTIASIATAAASVAALPTAGSLLAAVSVVGGVLLSSQSRALSEKSAFLGGAAKLGGLALTGYGAGVSYQSAQMTGSSSLSAAYTSATHSTTAGGRTAAAVHAHDAVESEATATISLADASLHRAAARREQDAVQEVIDDMRALEASVRRAIVTVLRTGKEQEQTRAATVSRIGRSAIA